MNIVASESIGECEPVEDAEIKILESVYPSVRRFGAIEWLKNPVVMGDEAGTGRGTVYIATGDDERVELRIYLPD